MELLILTVVGLWLVLALLKKDSSRYRAAQRPPRENVIDIGDIGQHKK